MDDTASEEVGRLLRHQDGVVSRRQIIDAGCTDADIRRMTRRRELARIHAGVFVEHTGQPTWIQRAWAATLLAPGSALWGCCALRAINGPGKSDHDDRGPIHICVDRSRVVDAPAGVQVHRVADFATKVHCNASPPRQRPHEAVIDVAASAPCDLDAVAALADAVRARLTRADRLAAALAGRSRIGRRDFLVSVIRDVGAGTCSTLEHGYLARVERAHGLPRAQRQVKASTRGVIYRDVDYAAYGVLVELDGRVHHSRSKDRDRDLDRDLDSLADNDAPTIRLGWGQVFDRPCRTAEALARILRRRGWAGHLEPCPDCAEHVGLTA